MLGGGECKILPVRPPHSTASSPSLVLLVFSQYWIGLRSNGALLQNSSSAIESNRVPYMVHPFAALARGQLHWPVTELLTN